MSFCVEMSSGEDPIAWLVNVITLGQSDNELWHMARVGRLTASSVSLAVEKLHKGKGVNYSSIAKDVYSSKQRNNYMNEAMRWGKEHESTALKAYKKRYPNFDVLEMGLCVDRAESEHVACSPDGVAIDLSTGEHILLEVKCPYSQRKTTNIYRAIVRGDIRWLTHFRATGKRSAKITINRLVSQGSNYYHQIQTSLKILGLDKCHLIVWTPRSCIVVNVPRSELWEAENWAHIKKIGEELHGMFQNILNYTISMSNKQLLNIKVKQTTLNLKQWVHFLAGKFGASLGWEWV